MDPTYNTIMAVSAGLGLVLIVGLGYQLTRGHSIDRHGWAAVFMVLGALLALTGAVMTLTWPLSGPTAFDNIAFGEPSLAMGALLIAGAVLLGGDRFWRPAPGIELDSRIGRGQWPRLRSLLQPLSWFGLVMGLALIAIAVVGPVYEPWEAPPQEPISGEFGDTPVLENTFLAVLYALTGIGAILLPFALARESLERAAGLLKAVGACWLIAGLVWTGFGCLNYYTHIGLTINTYKEEQAKTEDAAEEPPPANQRFGRPDP
jgi:uncharacterized membrane protein